MPNLASWNHSGAGGGWSTDDQLGGELLGPSGAPTGRTRKKLPAAAAPATAISLRRDSSNEDMGNLSVQGPLLVVRAGAGGELEQGAVPGAGTGDVEAEPGLDAGDRSVGVERPLLVVLPVAVPDDDLGA